MNVVLPRDLQEYVKSLVKRGKYAGCSEVIQEALRHHRVSRPGLELAMTPQLERLLDEGMEDLDEAKRTDDLRRPQ